MQVPTVIIDIDAVREALQSSARRVVVEAPAGCGKTYEAVSLACSIAAELAEPAGVLLLTHTHAAKAEFSKRAAQARGASRVRISTLDALLLELCAPHSVALGITHPLLAALRSGDVTFAQLASKALELLQRAPLIAEILSLKYPTILLDEHQDASITQHAVIEVIGSVGGSRLRFFGDPMQSIYSFDSAPVDWTALVARADYHCLLSKPWRWLANPQLGKWIQQARTNLEGALPLPAAPPNIGITVIHVANVAAPGYGGYIDNALIGPVRTVSDRASVAVLTRANRHAEALHLRMGTEFSLNEGADFEIARKGLEALGNAKHDPGALAAVVVALLADNCIGFDASKRKQCLDSIKQTTIEMGRKKLVSRILEPLTGIYAEPTIKAAIRALSDIIAVPPAWITRWTRPLNLSILRMVGDSPEEPAEAIESIINYERQVPKRALRSISTIHKAVAPISWTEIRVF